MGSILVPFRLLLASLGRLGSPWGPHWAPKQKKERKNTPEGGAIGVPMGTLRAPFSAIFRKKVHCWCPCWSPWGITLEGWELGPLFSQKVWFYLSKTTTFRRSPGSIFSPVWEQFGPFSAPFGSILAPRDHLFWIVDVFGGRSENPREKGPRGDPENRGRRQGRHPLQCT